MPVKRCVACGHTAADHVEGFMGARIDKDWYCHQDDHSCYVDATVAGSIPEALENLLRLIPSRLQ